MLVSGAEDGVIKVGVWRGGEAQNNVLFAAGNDFSVWTWMVPAADSLTVCAAAAREL